ncbi:hypothetical protein COCON_G00099600 [Conger conger]|uniref:Uncharacterized protein n=1 Tax=Conger conger TaxID=82655 RepID=A0A9Q1DMN3_CONCO|nr:hypothetical protein COCON_G00099600 [Conger conger]
MAANAATMRILIKGGKVVNDDVTQEADVYIENGIIQQVGRELMIPGGAKVIDATGKLVIPGGIDTSAHLQQSFMNATTVDDFYSGTKLGPCAVVMETRWSCMPGIRPQLSGKGTGRQRLWQGGGAFSGDSGSPGLCRSIPDIPAQSWLNPARESHVRLYPASGWKLTS